MNYWGGGLDAVKTAEGQAAELSQPKATGAQERVRKDPPACQPPSSPLPQVRACLSTLFAFQLLLSIFQKSF